jgi:hypothetical protein
MTKIFQPFTDLFTYLDYYRKARRIKSDLAEALAEWKRIGGIHASTGALLNFANDYSLILVEYATWTATDLDDKALAIVRDVLIDHRDTLEIMLDRIRAGQTMTTTEISAMTDMVSLTSDEYGDPMTVLLILTVLYRMLVLLRDGKLLPAPDTTPTPEPKRPIRNFIKTIFGKT